MSPPFKKPPPRAVCPTPHINDIRM
ncbi:hypothetical protein A2U01_0101144, partial [Trifolium medium]|nr:hypothetical protein [Trifolium medium]